MYSDFTLYFLLLLQIVTTNVTKVEIKIVYIVAFLPLYLNKKSCIRETLNLSTDADHRTDIFFWGGGMVKKIKKNVTCDM